MNPYKFLLGRVITLLVVLLIFAGTLLFINMTGQPAKGWQNHEYDIFYYVGCALVELPYFVVAFVTAYSRKYRNYGFYILYMILGMWFMYSNLEPLPTLFRAVLAFAYIAFPYFIGDVIYRKRAKSEESKTE